MNKKTGIYNLLVIWLICGCIFGILFTVIYYEKIKDNINNPSYISSCSNDSLYDAAYCLKSELKTFYNYNISNKGKSLTIDELKSKGGVCRHYSEWYANQMRNLGFNAKTVTFGVNDSYHEIAIASSNNNEQGYCLLDQKEVHCIGLG